MNETFLQKSFNVLDLQAVFQLHRGKTKDYIGRIADNRKDRLHAAWHYQSHSVEGCDTEQEITHILSVYCQP